MHADSWPMPPRRRDLAAALVAAALVACSTPPPEPAAGGDAVLARFEGGTITAQRLTEAVIALPAATRPKDPADREAWYATLVRRLAAHDRLVAQGRRDGLLSEPATAARSHDARKQVVVNAFLHREISVPAPTAAEIDAYYAAHREAFSSPERREVYHIFLRPEPGESRAELTARLESLRARHLAGEPFPLLAREHSQSQLRHDDGALGWITPGQLAPRLNDIVFGLEEGVPSPVLMTASGGHLFLATRVVAARTLTLDEARPEVTRRLLAERRGAAVAEYVAGLQPGAADYAPTEDELRALLAGGDPGALVQRVGEWTLTAGELLARLEELNRGPVDPAAAFGLLQSMANVETIYQAAVAAGLADDPEIARTLTAAEDALLFQEVQRRRLLERVAAEPDEVRAFFEQERGRFAGPLRLRVARLAVPVGAGGGAIMQRLQEALPDLERGAQTLHTLAAAVGGTVDEPAWVTLADLRSAGGRQRGRLAAVAVGGYSEPASNGREIELFHVLERADPEAPDFESVRDAVHDAYLQIHGERLHDALVDDELARAGFALVPGALARFAEQASGLPPAPAAD